MPILDLSDRRFVVADKWKCLCFNETFPTQNIANAKACYLIDNMGTASHYEPQVYDLISSYDLLDMQNGGLEKIANIIEKRGESFLNDDGVDQDVCHDVAQEIVKELFGEEFAGECG